jgi:ABC-type antimicrobial peptide transport system permease subunit
MFTSVLEKTREIGILKAIGAKKSGILVIFFL